MRKPKFRWKDKKERSLFDIVSEDGAMRTRDIFYIVRILCFLKENLRKEGGEKIYIHPKNIMVNIDGEVKLSSTVFSLSALEAYLPPELDRRELNADNTRIYGLGVLMLFMATGKEKKTDLSAFVGNRSLLSVIQRCIAFDPKERICDEKEFLAAIKESKGIRKKVISILFILIFICLTGRIALSFWNMGDTRGGIDGEVLGYEAGYIAGYRQGESDAVGIGISEMAFDAENGNLSGNYIARSGPIAAYSEDKVFFVQGENVYQMDPYSRKMQSLATDCQACSLNYYNGWLYCCTKDNVFRIHPKTGKKEEICDFYGGVFYIFNHNFYLYDMSDTGYLYRIDPKSKTLTQLNGEMAYHCLNVVNEKLYYIDLEKNGSIYCSDLDGGNVSLISSNSYESFCIYDNKIYAGTKDGLICMGLNGGNPERFTMSSAYFPNVSEGGIFYISGNGRTLEWMSLDGKTVYTVISTRTGIFNVVGGWIFYQNEEDNGNLWCVRVNGADNMKITGRIEVGK